jgi:hypothetical protein
VKVLMVAEIDITDLAMVQPKLDHFRETVLPSQEFGITLYRATQEDANEFAIRRDGLGRETWVPPEPVKEKS